MAVAAPARQAAPARAPARKPAPARRPATRRAAARPARVRTAPAPQRRRPAPKRATGHVIPLAAVRTATAVRRLPDSSLMVRMTRGRVWIGVLGVLLAGIVGLNVVTLSLAATAGQIDQNIQALDRENSILRSRDAQKSGSARVRHDAAVLGLTAASADEVNYLQASPRDAAIAAQRLAAAGTAY
ncbi:MAG TPA: hypothetical protein VNM89_05765 [Solirubrobacterales bacterium]|nr:hypothetical protein [Solirubrobacterales bacterium]